MQLSTSHWTASLLVLLALVIAAPEAAAQKREGGYVRGGIGLGAGQEFGVPGLHPLIIGPALTLALGTFALSPDLAIELHIDAMGGIDLIRPLGDRPLQGGANGVVRFYTDQRGDGGFAFGGAGVAFSGRNEYDEQTARWGPGAIAGAGWEDEWGRTGTWGVAAWYAPRLLTSGGFGFAHSAQVAIYLTIPLDRF